MPGSDQFKPTQFPNPIPYKILFVKYPPYQFMSTLWANLSQYLISKCYNSAQKLWKTITKSYKTYGKYSKKFQNFQGFFNVFRNVFYTIGYQDIFIYPGIFGSRS